MSVLCSGALGFPERLPEANIQAEFYHHCRLLGIACVLEFRTPSGRHDIGIFKNGFRHLVAIIECKRGYLNRKSRQIERYKRVGVPVYGLVHIAGAEGLARKIQADLLGPTGPCGIEREKLFEVVPLERRARKRTTRFSHTELDEDLIIRLD